ncbi:MAG: NADH:flavin oxidoreductase/NADH oxidase family protein [Desulfobacteraceae bacterium]|nr:NADH:flavin oxidoreductase/NADH oxidase family protein [Desulfobacteraceae bacterium]
MRKLLGDTIQLKSGAEVKNRLFKSAMSEQLGDKAHNPTKKLHILYGRWAEGGIGLSVTGNVMVDRNALGEPRNVVLDEISDLKKFRKWADQGKKNGAHIWMQLNHPGKQCPKFLDTEPVAPSAIPLEGGLSKAFNTPRALEEDEIQAIIKRFGVSAGLAKKAGFTGVQIHSAHGYLLNQFLSPHHNRRTDEWGGSLENRTRFVAEIYKAIRASVGDDFPVGIKLNSSDFRDGGFTLEEAILVAKKLEEEGIDLIEISGGSYENPSMMGKPGGEKEGYFMEYALAIRKAISIPLVLTGGFRSGAAMLESLDNGAADMIGLARPLALEPDFPEQLLKNPDYRISLPRLSTGITGLDKMVMIGLTWYEYQLYVIGKGKKVNPKVSEWKSAFLTFWRLGSHAFSQRRAKG